jgi:hypothetical protein
MNKEIVFIADFFADQINGGGELNNEELIHLLALKNYKITKVISRSCNLDFIKINKNNFFIIGNFVQLHISCLNYIQENCNYIIYEHDHKYLKTRNPADFKDYIAPKNQIVNERFFKNASAVLCQSIFHKNIILKNLDSVNAINLSGNLWSEQILNTLEYFSKKQKKEDYAVMNSNNWHKNTKDAITFCKSNNLNFVLIDPCEYKDFLNKLSDNKGLIFFPKTTETLSRIIVEARMMNMSVITNEKVGATYEDWFSLKGSSLIELMKEKRKSIPEIVERFIK